MLIMVMVSVVGYGADFRNVTWGMTEAQVRSAEAATFVHKQPQGPLDLLMYSDRLLDVDVFVGYAFIDNKLVRANYLLKETFINTNNYFKVFDKLSAALDAKYGEVKLNVKWLNNTYQGDSNQYGLALSMGHLVARKSWDLPNTLVQLGMFGENFKVTLVIEYRSKKLMHLETEAKDNVVSDQL